METKGKSLAKAAVFVAVTAAIILGGYAFADVVLAGRAANWFEKTFFIDMGIAYWNNGGSVHVHVLRWDQLKHFLLECTLILGTIWALTIALTHFLAARAAERDTARRIGKMMRAYFAPGNEEAVFPKKYEDVAAYAAILKDQFQHSEEILRAESERKNDLIAYLAHDLKTPLTSVIGYLSLLKEAPDMPAEQRAKYTSITLNKSLRLESLINEFFDITRYNLHEIVLEEERFDLGYMLMQMADEFYPVLEPQGKTISIHADDELSITADPDKLARVFHNILKNAIAYSYDHTDIEIKAAREGQSLVISVANFGKTIPKQKLDSIFEKFYRLDDARSTNTGGAGLGLAIAKEIVTAHGGSISVSSEKQVTTFTVVLPMSPQAEN